MISSQTIPLVTAFRCATLACYPNITTYEQLANTTSLCITGVYLSVHLGTEPHHHGVTKEWKVHTNSRHMLHFNYGAEGAFIRPQLRPLLQAMET